MKKTYLCLFLISFSALTLEVTLARLLSIIAWYHLAFFALSTAMLGMTAGAIHVYLNPEEFRAERIEQILMKSSFQYSLSIPCVLILLCLIPLPMVKTLMSIFALLLATFLCSLPFYFFGIITTTALTKSSMPIGKLYAADLVGASAGCLFALEGLENLDPPSLLLLCAAIGALAGLCFATTADKRQRNRLVACFVILLAATFLNAITFYAIRPLTMKGIMVAPGVIAFERSNSLSRVVVFKEALLDAQLWGPSPIAPKEKTKQYVMNIDGDAATIVRPFKTEKDLAHLRYDVVNTAYYLRGSGGACVIGVGGGRDLQSALLFGHKRVVGIDVNRTFINLLKNEFRDYAGLANRAEVQLVADEARSYLTRHQEKFAVLQMSLIDTWASTAAGSFSLSENTLYTLESWKIFINHLKSDGIFTVSRWHGSKNLGETGRLVSLATASLLDAGVRDSSRHLALITSNDISTLLLGRSPFSNEDIHSLKALCDRLQFKISILPGEPAEHAVLRTIVSSKSRTELNQKVKDFPLNFLPTTDESPYFFNILKIGSIGYLFANSEVWASFAPGIMMGNMVATLTLTVLTAGLFIVALFTIIFPLVFNKTAINNSNRRLQFVAPSAVYFALIGAGFMLSEIALIQRLSVFLGHPVYALGIILFTLILSTGIGSLLSEKININRPSFVFLAVLTAAVIITERFLLKFVFSKFIDYEILTKIGISVFFIFPLGILFGCFFPAGMRLVKNISASETPWYWALNGIFGVFCSALAIFISIYGGISLNFYLAACCYLGLVPCQIILQNIKLEQFHPQL
jgi:hypothetical protein